MNHDSEAERAKFEAWRRRTAKMDPDAAVALHGFGDDADYEHRTTNAMWVGWQAALMSRPTPSAQDVSQELGKGDRWLPIETAPSDTAVLLFSPDPSRIEARVYHDTRAGSWHGWATHWQPLPAPPAQEQKP